MFRHALCFHGGACRTCWWVVRVRIVGIEQSLCHVKQWTVCDQHNERDVCSPKQQRGHDAPSCNGDDAAATDSLPTDRVMVDGSVAAASLVLLTPSGLGGRVCAVPVLRVGGGSTGILAQSMQSLSDEAQHAAQIGSSNGPVSGQGASHICA